jgi:acetyltransferase-like isoleucine patch superfamily enzyme
MADINKISLVSRSEMHSIKNYLGQGVFQTLYAFVKYIPLPIIGNFLRYAVLKIFMKKLQTTYIDEMVTVYFPWNVEVGKRSSLNQGVIVDGTAPVRIGKGVRIAANVYINTADHEIKTGELIANQGFVIGEVVIEDDVWIGAGAILLKGITIGKGSVIGAGSVVTKDIPPYSIAVGAPCKAIKKRNK